MNTYIGARYVPKFMGTYDPTQIYDNLCVVDNGLGTLYITKIKTPAGTPLTNTTYWTVYSGSSAQIQNLQDQIDDINNLIDPNTALTTTSQVITGAVNELDARLDDMTGNNILSDVFTITVTSDGTDTFITLFDKLLIAIETGMSGITSDKVLPLFITEPNKGKLSIPFRDYYDPSQLTAATFPHMHACANVLIGGNTIDYFGADLRETGASHLYVMGFTISSSTAFGADHTNQTAYPYPADTPLTFGYQLIHKLS